MPIKLSPYEIGARYLIGKELIVDSKSIQNKLILKNSKNIWLYDQVTILSAINKSIAKTKEQLTIQHINDLNKLFNKIYLSDLFSALELVTFTFKFQEMKEKWKKEMKE